MPSSSVPSGSMPPRAVPPAAVPPASGPRGAGRSPDLPAAEVGGFARRSALGFVAVVVGALLLALAVQLAAGPLLQVDQHVAGSLNTVVAPRPWLVTLLQVLTAPGAAITAWIVLSTLTVGLLIRRRYRLAVYVAVTGLGTAVLSPLLKQLVDRLRPMVDTPVAAAGGPSFPSGHTLAVTVWVGVVLLVLLPVVPPRRRRLVVGIGVALVVVVGLTRIALGVHFVSDVLAGWLIGTGWLLVTATAFRAWRRHEGLAVPPAVDGLAPEVARRPRPRARATTRAPVDDGRPAARRGGPAARRGRRGRPARGARRRGHRLRARRRRRRRLARRPPRAVARRGLRAARRAGQHEGHRRGRASWRRRWPS